MRTGQCLCGGVTWQFDGEPKWVAHCHCESCRKNCAAPFTTFLGVDNGALVWTGQTPSVFASSPGVERLFCGTCGTPVAYRSDRWPGETHLYLAALDDASGLVPTAHVNWSEHVDWITLGDGLKRYDTTGG